MLWKTRLTGLSPAKPLALVLSQQLRFICGDWLDEIRDGLAVSKELPA
jgi:hypothetical protein